LPTFSRSGVIKKQHALSVSPSSMRQPRYHRTSQSFTPFIISCSRANAARSRRYASLSPSANNSGTRCMRDQIFSLCSSLENSPHLNQSSFPILNLHKWTRPDLEHDKESRASRGRIHRTPRSPLGSTNHLTRSPSRRPERFAHARFFCEHPPLLNVSLSDTIEPICAQGSNAAENG
jgi:hypothetical protein